MQINPSDEGKSDAIVSLARELHAMGYQKDMIALATLRDEGWVLSVLDSKEDGLLCSDSPTAER